ncbi:hypothetical protein AQ505_17405 [Pedobacter sp. PACM 27299]|uniref:hypothetical protein n=1 Tax=Pedobacter sp. PACM 27299 TaxID=1727164 RepID=UPI0007056837|nr:hypothetical protein [Pedobacter sp. PACM 27299]ALL07105.1 hypothetical protein AQ505_17405 [Pedobacter sp. PACM 27299]
MNHANQIEKKCCENCGELIVGRTDKRFCDTYCKNTFNSNRRKAERFQEYDNLPEIFKIIKNNHEILKTYQPAEFSEQSSTEGISRQELLAKGFNFRFFTSIQRDTFGEYWKFCFDYGWRENGYDYCSLSHDIQAIALVPANQYLCITPLEN